MSSLTLASDHKSREIFRGDLIKKSLIYLSLPFRLTLTKLFAQNTERKRK